jgi:hypothetical protein
MKSVLHSWADAAVRINQLARHILDQFTAATPLDDLPTATVKNERR